MEIFLELLKYTVPAFVVFLTAYFLLKLLLDEKYSGQIEELKRQNAKIGLPLRLQAYERFTLLCERVDLGALMLRLRAGDMTADQLKISMMVAINQEFEHNLSQQMYLSETLWQILTLAREETYEIIQSTPSSGVPLDTYIDGVFTNVKQIGGVTPFQKALSAIRAEVKTIV